MGTIILIVLALIAVFCIFFVICAAQVAGRARGFEEGYLFDKYFAKAKKEQPETKDKDAQQQQQTN